MGPWMVGAEPAGQPGAGVGCQNAREAALPIKLAEAGRMTMPVHQRASAAGWTRRPIPHVAAALLALYYAWLVSNTRFVTTGLEFVAPLAIVLATHLAW